MFMLTPPRELVADVELGSGQIVAVFASPVARSLLRDALDALCEAISDEYDALDRRPTQRELLGTFAFVLGYAPDVYLDIEMDSSVRGIRAA
jgi:hypothetical protein